MFDINLFFASVCAMRGEVATSVAWLALPARCRELNSRCRVACCFHRVTSGVVVTKQPVIKNKCNYMKGYCVVMELL